MKKFLYNIKLDIELFIERNLEKIDIMKYKRKYPDYKVDEYNIGSIKFIWGCKSWDDLSSKHACLYSMNDIDICYDRDSKEYMLGIETAFLFDDKNDECNYLAELLNKFTKYMDENNLSKKDDFCFFMNNMNTTTTAKTIEDLYTNFRIFVEGYCKLYSK